MKALLTLLGGLFVLAITASAQTPVGFNIAIQDPTFPVVPSPAYGAAAYQAGYWNRVTGQGPFTSVPLVDVNGNPSMVTVEIAHGTQYEALDLAATTGDDEILLDHGLFTVHFGLPVRIHNIPPGSYRLFSYVVGGSFAYTSVSIPSSVDLEQYTTSYLFSPGFVQGQSHTVHRINVQAGVPLQLYWSAGAFLDGRLDGFQIVPDGTSQGFSYCDSTINSTGSMASMVFGGTPSVAANNLILGVQDLPPNQFGYFLVSQTQGTGVIPPGSQGTLCIGGAVGRHNRSGEVLHSGPSGVVRFPLDLTSVPRPLGAISVSPSETWNWQYWYRDQNPSSTSNFSDGNRITFTP